MSKDNEQLPSSSRGNGQEHHADQKLSSLQSFNETRQFSAESAKDESLERIADVDRCFGIMETMKHITDEPEFSADYQLLRRLSKSQSPLSGSIGDSAGKDANILPGGEMLAQTFSPLDKSSSSPVIATPTKSTDDSSPLSIEYEYHNVIVSSDKSSLPPSHANNKVGNELDALLLAFCNNMQSLLAQDDMSSVKGGATPVSLSSTSVGGSSGVLPLYIRHTLQRSQVDPAALAAYTDSCDSKGVFSLSVTSKNVKTRRLGNDSPGSNSGSDVATVTASSSAAGSSSPLIRPRFVLRERRQAEEQKAQNKVQCFDGPLNSELSSPISPLRLKKLLLEKSDSPIRNAEMKSTLPASHFGKSMRPQTVTAPRAVEQFQTIRHSNDVKKQSLDIRNQFLGVVCGSSTGSGSVKPSNPSVLLQATDNRLRKGSDPAIISMKDMWKAKSPKDRRSKAVKNLAAETNAVPADLPVPKKTSHSKDEKRKKKPK